MKFESNIFLDEFLVEGQKFKFYLTSKIGKYENRQTSENIHKREHVNFILKHVND